MTLNKIRVSPRMSAPSTFSFLFCNDNIYYFIGKYIEDIVLTSQMIKTGCDKASFPENIKFAHHAFSVFNSSFVVDIFAT